MNTGRQRRTSGAERETWPTKNMRMPLLSTRSVRELTRRSSLRRARVFSSAVSSPDDGVFAVAPMMDYTDRFLRFMLRQLSKKQMLYTEMVVAQTLVHCDESLHPLHLGLSDAREQPVTLQIGGAKPEMLRKAAAIAEPYGYSRLNLNCGCPSDRVSDMGKFGAALMHDPLLVADCAAALADGVGHRLPISVKCRIGIVKDRKKVTEVDDEADFEKLCEFVETVSQKGGVRHFIVHARKAVLGGLLSPAENREIPPLRQQMVTRLVREFPLLRFSLNGGLQSVDECKRWLNGEMHESSTGEIHADGVPPANLAGVMVGRAICHRPWDFAMVDTHLFGCESNPASSRRQVLDEYCSFFEEWERANGRRARFLILKPALSLFTNEPKSKMFRRRAGELLAQKDASGESLLSTAEALRRAAEEELLPQTLDAPPGTVWHSHSKEYLLPEEAQRRIAAAATERDAPVEVRPHAQPQALGTA